MHIFGCLSVLLLFVVILAFSLVRGFFRILFGGGNRTDSTSRQRTYTSRQDEDTTRSSSGPYPSPKKKVIDEDEGEYVDFEEVDK